MKISKILFISTIVFITTTTGIILEQISSGGIFSTVSLSVVINDDKNDFRVIPFRKSVKGYYQAFDSTAEKNQWVVTKGTTAEIGLILEKSRLRDLNKVQIEIGLQKFKFESTEILSWEIIDAPSTIIGSTPKDIFLKVPSVVFSPSLLRSFLPIINWNIQFSFIGIIIFISLCIVFILLLYYFSTLQGTTNLFFQKDAFNSYTIYALPFIGFGFSLYLIFTFASSLFWMDQIALISTLEHWESDDLQFSHLWEQHNEHRVFTTKVVFMLLTFVKPFNNYLMTGVGQFFQLIAALLIVKAFMKSPVNKNTSKVKILISVFIVSAIIFSPAHIENTIFPFHQQWHLSFLGSVLTCYGASQNKSAYSRSFAFWFGLILWFLSSPSWIVVIPTIFTWRLYDHILNENRIILNDFIRREWRSFSVLIFVSMILLAFYFTNWHSVADRSFLVALTRPVAVSKFFFSVLGNQIPLPYLSTLAGVGIFSISIFCLWYNAFKRRVIQNDIIILFIIISWGLAFITAVGRVDGGSPIYSRYVNMSSLIWIACLYIAFTNFEKLSYLVNRVIVTICISLLSVQLLFGFYMGNSYKKQVEIDYALLKKSLKEKDASALKYSMIYSNLDKKDTRDKILSQYQWLINNGYFELKK